MLSLMRARLLVFALIVFVVTFGVAYAYGTQAHTVNGVYHGCHPSDYGCTGSAAGDYYRTGFTAGWNGANLSKPWVSIIKISDGGQRSYGWCSYCNTVSAGWDTNPYYECDYRTLHVVPSDTGSKLNSHSHYTAAATGTWGC